MHAVLYGDYVSLYLAALHSLDPALTPAADELRARLAAMR
jgi:hypothetical protein